MDMTIRRRRLPFTVVLVCCSFFCCEELLIGQTLCLFGTCSSGQGGTPSGKCMDCGDERPAQKTREEPRSETPSPPAEPQETTEQRALRERADAQTRHYESVWEQEKAMENAARAGEYDNAKRIARNLLASRPPAVLIPRLNHYLVNMTFARAYDALNVGDWPNAEREFKTALEELPNNPEAHSSLGKALEGEGKLDEALLEYQSAARLSENKETQARQDVDRVRATVDGRRAAVDETKRMTAAAVRTAAMAQLRQSAGTGQAAAQTAAFMRAKCAGSLVWDSWSDDRCQETVVAVLPTVNAPGTAAAHSPATMSAALRSRLGDLDEQLAAAKQRLFGARTPEDMATADRAMKNLREQKGRALVQVVHERWISVPVRPTAQH